MRKRWRATPFFVRRPDWFPLSSRKCSWMATRRWSAAARSTEKVLRRVFAQLHAQGAMLEGMILKPNMALPGLACATQETVDEVAEATVNCLLRVVPAAVPGIAFLSGGQSGELASARFSAMNVKFQGFGVATALGSGLFLRARHPATCLGNMEGRADKSSGGSEGSLSSSALQRGRAPRRIQRRDGNGVSATTGLPKDRAPTTWRKQNDPGPKRPPDSFILFDTAKPSGRSPASIPAARIFR